MRRLEDELARYGQTDAYPFHMPGHKRQAALLPDLSPASVDITEIDGFDNLHDPESLILEEMTTAAAFYGARQTFFSVNGATCALLAAISAAAPRGSRILIERTSHMAVYHAAYLRGLEVSYISAELAERVCGQGERSSKRSVSVTGGAGIDKPLGKADASNRPASVTGGTGIDKPLGKADAAKRSASVTGSVGAGSGSAQGAGGADLENVFISQDRDQVPPIAAVVITSPTYEGCVKDVAAWAAYAHARGAVLIVDEAHGAHFSMHPAFPVSAVRRGADLVVQSTHKTLPAMTQTALLHRVSDRVPGDRIQYFFDIYETSSPSYVLMASITSAIHLCMDRGEGLFEAYWQRLRRLRGRLAGLRRYHLMGGRDGVLSYDDELPGFAAGTVTDPGKIVLLGDAPALYAALRDRFHLQPEMKTDTYVLCMTSFADTEEGFDRLAGAMEILDAEADGQTGGAPGGEGEIVGQKNGAPGGESGIVGQKNGAPAGEGGIIGQKTGASPAEEGSFVRQGAFAGSPFIPQPQAMTLAEAADASRERVPLEAAVGRIAGDFLILYPPDVPVIVPGEVFTQELVANILKWQKAGLNVLGLRQGKADIIKW